MTGFRGWLCVSTHTIYRYLTVAGCACRYPLQPPNQNPIYYTVFSLNIKSILPNWNSHSRISLPHRPHLQKTPGAEIPAQVSLPLRPVVRTSKNHWADFLAQVSHPRRPVVRKHPGGKSGPDQPFHILLSWVAKYASAYLSSKTWRMCNCALICVFMPKKRLESL